VFDAGVDGNSPFQTIVSQNYDICCPND
jgi:hypothetical protein